MGVLRDLSLMVPGLNELWWWRANIKEILKFSKYSRNDFHPFSLHACRGRTLMERAIQLEDVWYLLSNYFFPVSFPIFSKISVPKNPSKFLPLDSRSYSFPELYFHPRFMGVPSSITISICPSHFHPSSIQIPP